MRKANGIQYAFCTTFQKLLNVWHAKVSTCYEVPNSLNFNENVSPCFDIWFLQKLVQASQKELHDRQLHVLFQNSNMVIEF